MRAVALPLPAVTPRFNEILTVVVILKNMLVLKLLERNLKTESLKKTNEFGRNL